MSLFSQANKTHSLSFFVLNNRNCKKKNKQTEIFANYLLFMHCLRNLSGEKDASFIHWNSNEKTRKKNNTKDIEYIFLLASKRFPWKNLYRNSIEYSKIYKSQRKTSWFECFFFSQLFTLWIFQNRRDRENTVFI